MEQNKIIPGPQQDAIQTAGDFYGMVIPDEDLKRRRPVQDFKAGAEWQYKYLTPEMEAMRKALEKIYDRGMNRYIDGDAPAYLVSIAKEVLDQYPSPINNNL